MGVRSRYSDCSLYYVHSYTTCYIISPFLEAVISQNIGNISYMQISPKERWVGSVCVGLCDANVASYASGKIKQVAPERRTIRFSTVCLASGAMLARSEWSGNAESSCYVSYCVTHPPLVFSFLSLSACVLKQRGKAFQIC